jgi:hypothetical protein
MYMLWQVQAACISVAMFYCTISLQHQTHTFSDGSTLDVALGSDPTRRLQVVRCWVQQQIT